MSAVGAMLCGLSVALFFIAVLGGVWYLVIQYAFHWFALTLALSLTCAILGFVAFLWGEFYE